ncbi:MAG: histidinol-phosphate transaminase [Micavibrio sp.]|nr:histidinol-phosphate transaminase [Micavibrio sp.]
MHETIKNLIRTHFSEMEGYVSAGMEMKKSAQKIFLNANENPYTLPGLENYNRYPQPQPEDLLKAYGTHYGVAPDKIVMTRGADEAIAVLVRVFCEPGRDKILICPPTFGIYAVDAHAMPAQVVEAPLLKKNGTFSLDSENIIKAASDDDSNVKIVFLCNPNNPSGTSFDQEKIIEIAKALEGKAIVIVDETYAEFSKQESLCEQLEALPNVIILRTLSKSFSLAGLRMGSLICNDTDFIKLVQTKALETYPLPQASVDAALHVFKPEIQTIAQENIDKILAERSRYIPLLEQSKLVQHIYPSDANFLLVEMKKAHDFYKFAAQKNLILRNFSDKALIENCLRISIGTPEQNDLVLAALKEFENTL